MPNETPDIPPDRQAPVAPAAAPLDYATPRPALNVPAMGYVLATLGAMALFVGLVAAGFFGVLPALASSLSLSPLVMWVLLFAWIAYCFYLAVSFFVRSLAKRRRAILERAAKHTPLPPSN